MANDLKIRLIGTLDKKLTKDEINLAIKDLQGKVDKLNIEIKIDDKILKTLNDFANQMRRIGNNVFGNPSQQNQQNQNLKNQAKSLNDLINGYKKLNEQIKYNADGSVKSITRKYEDTKGNGRIITTDVNDKVINYKDIENIQKFEKEQQKLRQSLMELGRTGKYTSDELRKIGQGINTASTLKEIEQLQNRMKNMRMGTSFEQDQERLRTSLERVFNQGKINEQEFNRINSAINSSKNIAELEKLQRELNKLTTTADAKNLQQKLVSDAQKLLRTHSGTVDTTGVEDFINRVRGINPASQNALNGLRNLQTELTEFRNNAQVATRHTMTFGEQLRVAFERVPVWAVATTAIYGTSAAVKDLIDNLILVDGQMTELKRVMDEDTNFTALLDESIQMSKELGRSLEDVNNAIILAAKTGADAKDSLDLARTATIASNVSELTAEEAMQNLISITTQFNMKASESIDVINKLNEVDNQFATSTKDLSDSLARAGAVAKTYNITLDEMVGLSTAMQVATRASGSEVGNSLKTIISRLSADESLSALKEVGIFIEDTSNASEILKKISESWNQLSSAQQQNLGVVIAGRWQLSKFLGLMNNYQMVLDSTETSLNSENSAIIENQKYLNSMEAKLADLKNSWFELSLAMGDSGFSDVFIGAVLGLTKLANGASEFVKSFGSIPTIFAVASASALLFSKNIRTFFTTMSGVNSFRNSFQRINDHLTTTGTLIRANTVGMTGFQRATTATSIAWNTLSVSIRGALISTGIGAIIVGVTYALGKLVEKLIETQREQAKVKKEAEQLALTYSNHEDEITSLVGEYEKLQSKVKEGLLSENDERYVEVQNELNKLLPNLTAKTDQLGNARLKSSEAIKSEIDYLKKLSNLESQKFIDNFSKKVDESSEKINDLKVKIDELTNGTYMNTGEFGGAFIAPDKSAEGQIERLVKQKELKVATDELVKSYNQLGTEYAKVMGYSNVLTKDDQDYISTIINKNREILATEDGMKKVEGQIKSFVISIGEVRKATGNIFSNNEIENFSKDQIGVLNSISSGIKDGYTDWEQYRQILGTVGFTSDEVNAIIDRLKNNIIEESKATEIAKLSTEELSQKLSDAKGNFSSLSEIMLYLAKAGQYNEAVTVAQGEAYESMASEIEPLNGLLETLAEGKSISAAQAMELIAKEGELANAISVENGVVKVNQEAVLNLRNAKIAAYQDMINAVQAQVQAQSAGLVTKLKNYGVEIQAIMSVAQANEALAKATEKRNSTMKKINDSKAVGSMYASMVTENQYQGVVSDINSIKSAYSQLEKLSATAPTALSQVGTSSANPDKKSGSGGKKGSSGGSDKSVEIYQTDKYKQKMDELNDTLKQSEFLTKRLDKTSAEYRAELVKQSETVEQMSTYTLGQVSALEARNNALKSQIASMGNVNRLSNDQKEVFNNLTKELEDNTSQVYQLKDAWRGYQEQLLQMQDDLRNSVADQIADEEEKRLAILEQEIEDVNNAYDDSIAKLQEQLDLLEETEDIEDRLAKLREKDNEISKEKSDKRYSYITAQGEEILTYNKEKVSELEKERDEMVKQYERADLKKAIQDEIERTNKAKDDMNKALTKRKDDFKKYWDQLVSDARAGTLSFDALQRAWSDRTIASLTAQVNSTGKQLDNIGGMYVTLGEIARNMDSRMQQMNSSLYTQRTTASGTMSGMSSDMNSFGGAYTGALGGIANASSGILGSMENTANKSVNNIQSALERLKKAYDDAMNRAQKLASVWGIEQVDSGRMGAWRSRLQEAGLLPQYHDGGIIGGLNNEQTELANKLFNAKPNEQIVKALKGELMIPPQNIPNLFTNLKNLVSNNKQVGAIDQSKHISIANMEVRANNPMEFFQGLDNALRSQ